MQGQQFLVAFSILGVITIPSSLIILAIIGNGLLDTHPPVIWTSEVLSREKISKQGTYDYNFLINDWNNPGQQLTFNAGLSLFKKVKQGDKVTLTIGRGFLGYE